MEHGTRQGTTEGRAPGPNAQETGRLGGSAGEGGATKEHGQAGVRPVSSGNAGNAKGNIKATLHPFLSSQSPWLHPGARVLSPGRLGTLIKGETGQDVRPARRLGHFRKRFYLLGRLNQNVPFG